MKLSRRLKKTSKYRYVRDGPLFTAGAISYMDRTALKKIE